MARVRVDTDSLGNVARMLDDRVAQAAQLMSDMRDDVHGLDGQWEGNNHDDFMAGFDERKDAIKLHGLAMEKFSDSLNATVKIYQELEAEIEQVVARL